MNYQLCLIEIHEIGPDFFFFKDIPKEEETGQDCNLFTGLFTQFSFLGVSGPWELRGFGMKSLLEASPGFSWHCW